MRTKDNMKKRKQYDCFKILAMGLLRKNNRIQAINYLLQVFSVMDNGKANCKQQQQKYSFHIHQNLYTKVECEIKKVTFFLETKCNS